MFYFQSVSAGPHVRVSVLIVSKKGSARGFHVYCCASKTSVYRAACAARGEVRSLRADDRVAYRVACDLKLNVCAYIERI